ncbi:MAG: DUF547 domain-containing protein [Vicinamibacteria bacterium]
MVLQLMALVAALAAVPLQTEPQSSAAGSIHAPFTALLHDNTQHGLVDYDAFTKSLEFPVYLQSLASARIDSWPKSDRLAYWLNVYNAYTIQLINLHKERESVRNINMFLGVLRGKGPWKEEIVKAAGRVYSLDDVEKMIRAEFKDPRVHMAMARATLSSPPLREEAYEGSKINAQLDDQTRTYLRDRQTINRLDLGNSILYASEIFDWFHADFGKGNTGILKFFAPYFEGAGERFAFEGSKLTIEFSEYDWRLNILQPRVTQ